jgi:hypothetical protein
MKTKGAIEALSWIRAQAYANKDFGIGNYP